MSDLSKQMSSLLGAFQKANGDKNVPLFLVVMPQKSKGSVKAQVMSLPQLGGFDDPDERKKKHRGK